MTDQPPSIPDQAPGQPPDQPADAPASEGTSYTIAPAPRDRWAHRRTEPRPFALLWITFLLSASALTLGAVGAAVIPSTEMYRHATRILFLLMALGVTIFWPMLRLCQARPQSPRRAVLLDLLVLVPPLHFLAWPQCFAWMAQWSTSTAAAVAVALSAWSLLIGALLALALFTEPEREPPTPTPSPSPPTARRSAWMIAILMLVIAGPFATLSGGPDTLALASPVALILDLIRDQQALRADTLPTAAHWWAIGLTAGAAFLGWFLLGIPAHAPRSQSPIVPVAKGPEEA